MDYIKVRNVDKSRCCSIIAGPMGQWFKWKSSTDCFHAHVTSPSRTSTRDEKCTKRKSCLALSADSTE